MRTCSVVAVAVLSVVGTGCSSRTSGSRKVRIAAAAGLEKAFTALGKEFESRTKIAPQLTFGSSGLLSKQIEQGAPFFLFAAANKEFAEAAVKAGRCDGSSARLYARGRIVVWTASGGPAPVKLADLAKPEFKRIAIANPEHAPYGLAAKQALEKAGIWAEIEPRLVLGDNIQATMLYAKERNVDAALVALSLAVVNDGGTSLAIDPSMHDPLDQELVVCGTGEEADAARQFADFVMSREGREVMSRYGFQLPPTAKPEP
ncbi:molybdate ABC transporter substrate-binding protein [soil metagenome]